MENELWKKVYQLVTNVAKGKTLKRATYSHADIVLTYLWAVLHDRPIYWSCKKCNWPIYYRRRSLPNPSTMTRRLRTQQIQTLLKNIEQHLVNLLPESICRWIDAKPLTISSARVLAVRKMTGISLVAGSCFKCSHTSNPSISGIMMSNKIKSGGLRVTMLRASLPL